MTFVNVRIETKQIVLEKTESSHVAWQNWTEKLKVENDICCVGSGFQKQTFYDNFNIRFFLCEGKNLKVCEKRRTEKMQEKIG